MDEQTTISGNGARPIQCNLGAHFACVSLNQWMALTPPELVRAHLNLDQQTLAALRRDRPFVVASQHRHPTVAIDVENIDDHRQRDLVVDSGVSVDWTNERTQRFVRESLNSLREVAAQGADAKLESPAPCECV